VGRFIKKHKKEIGISPDELWFRGEQKIENALLRIIDFDTTNLEEKNITSVKELEKFKEKDSITWFNIDGLHNTALMEEIASVFNLDKIILADVMNTNGRPKVQEYDNCLYISVKMLQQDESTDFVSVENLCLILTDSVLISFQEKKGDVFEPVRERIRKQKKGLRIPGLNIWLLLCLMLLLIITFILLET